MGDRPGGCNGVVCGAVFGFVIAYDLDALWRQDVSALARYERSEAAVFLAPGIADRGVVLGIVGVELVASTWALGCYTTGVIARNCGSVREV